jgi:hypothetical protein
MHSVGSVNVKTGGICTVFTAVLQRVDRCSFCKQVNWILCTTVTHILMFSANYLAIWYVPFHAPVSTNTNFLQQMKPYKYYNSLIIKFQVSA